MDEFDMYTRAVIFNLVNASYPFGQHYLGLYKIENMFQANRALHMEAAAQNRYTTRMYRPMRSGCLTSPYVYYYYVGYHTAEIIPLTEYDPQIKQEAIEHMFKLGDIKLGQRVEAPQEYGKTPMRQIIMP